jgi:hypothetical protein
MKLVAAWIVRALILLPGALVFALMYELNSLDLWSWRVVTEHRQQRAERRRAELMSPDWPWT